MDSNDFKVVDKRRFTETGESKETIESERIEDVNPASETASQTFPPVDFSMFILSLSTSVLFHLGEIPDPQTKKTQKNLELAKHTIDIIDMLNKKTKGNLTEGETKLTENILYDLKMRYVNASK